jgi:hypothetical protein
MPLSYNTDLQFPLLIDYYLSSGLINVGHLVHGILARHHTASIMSEWSDYNLEVATIVLHFIMLIQCYLDTFLFASVTKFLIFLHIPLQRTGKCPSISKNIDYDLWAK